MADWQHNYFGEHASDSACLSYVTTEGYSPNNLGTIVYYNSKNNNLRVFVSGTWYDLTNVVGSDKVSIDAGATPGYIGATSGTGVLRTDASIAYADGGDFVTLSVDETQLDHDSLNGVANSTAHTKFLLLDGTRAMAGDLDLNGNKLLCDVDGNTYIDTSVDDVLSYYIGANELYSMANDSMNIYESKELRFWNPARAEHSIIWRDDDYFYIDTVVDANLLLMVNGVLITTIDSSGLIMDPAMTIEFALGTSINEFSTDGTMAGNSDDAVPTEKAVVTYVDATGIPRDEWLRSGFEDRTTSTLTWTDAGPDYTLSIQPTGANFDYWHQGIKYTTTGDTVQIDNTKEGIHLIYYDGATLTAFANPDYDDVRDVIINQALVSILYWDTSSTTAIYVGEERHGKSMAGDTHALIHFTDGLSYLSGLGLNTFAIDGAGATADAQFGVDAGSVSDEDIYIPISAVLSTTGLPIYYMLNAGEWQKHTEAGFSVRTVDGTNGTRLAYNQYIAPNWQLTDVGNNDFVLCHVFATTEKDYPMIAIMGQNKYTTKKNARKGALTEIFSLILDSILFPEIRPIATVIFQTSLGYASAVNGRVVSTDEGDDYIDWRNEVISRTEISTTDHGSLSGLLVDDHTQYLLADGTRNVSGNMIFDVGLDIGNGSLINFWNLMNTEFGMIYRGDDYFHIDSGNDGDLSLENNGSAGAILTSQILEMQAGFNFDLNGNKLILDLDGDTSITADTDDQIDFEIAGKDFIIFKDADYTFMSDSADMYIHLEEYSSNTSQMSRLKFRKSASDTLGTKVETIDAEYLGQINFEGTNSSSSFHLGASIYAKQSGASGVSKVPTDLYFFTSTDTTDNEWFIIRSDGDIEVTNGTSIEFYNVADGEHGEIYRDDDYLILDPGAGGLLKLVGDIHLDNDADIYFGDENMFDRLRKPTEQYIETWWLLTMDADLWSQTDAPSSSWTIQKDFTPPILAVQGWIACADDISDGEGGSFELTYRDWEVFPDQLGDEWMQKTLNLEWEALFDMIANVNDTKFFMGFCVDPDSDRASNEILGFIFDTIGGDLEALSDSGGTETTSGVIGITPNQKNLFKIKITEGHAYFYVNGTQEADLTTNLPEKLMHPIFRGDATGGNAFFAYGKIRIWWSDE